MWEPWVGFDFDPGDRRTKDYEGHVLTRMSGGFYSTSIGNTMAIGDSSILRTLVDVHRGEHKGLEGTAIGERHGAILKELGDGVVLATVVLDGEMKKRIADNFLEGVEIQSLGIRFDFNDGTVLIQADAATRSALLKRLETMKEDVRNGIAEGKESLDDFALPLGIGVILADQHVDKVFSKIAPQEEGDYLRLELTVETASMLYLVGVLGVGVRSYLAGAKVDAVRAQLNNISNHLEMLLFENDEYPTSLDELTRNRAGRRTAVLKESHLKDPWNETLRYENVGDSFVLCSSGKDKRHKTADDICLGSNF